jgi:hypothetical protein
MSTNKDRDIEGAIPVSAPTRSDQQVWPKVVIALGLGLTVVWTILLVFGITKLVEIVI